jgi:catechol 2,3-dioxygenase-like lactoylglutathione lyase family enzyme
MDDRMLRQVRTKALVGCMLAGMVSCLCAQTQVKRPHILGISHGAVYVHDLSRARAFYEGFLGFGESLTLKGQDGAERIALVKINDEQSLELFAEDAPGDVQLSHIAIYTDDVEHMWDYLVSRGVFVPDKVHKGQNGNLFFTVKDPSGHLVEIVEYKPDGLNARTRGQFLTANRVSGHLTHIGILAGSVGPTLKFYRDILGFREFWHGSTPDEQQHWISIRVPDGDDYLELMLYRELPPAKEQGLQNHLGLETCNLTKTIAELRARTATYPYSHPIDVQVGKDSKQHTDLWDPDGTRIEITESTTGDGTSGCKPTSGAP